MPKIYTKHFEYKGQMINYFNKIRNNEKIKWAAAYLDMKEGYTIIYHY